MKNNKIKADKITIKESIEQFWRGTQQDNAIFNKKAD